MSENSEFEPEKLPADDRDAIVEGEPGQYVDGDYGSAGIAGEETAAAAESDYPDGSYGAAGDVVEETAGAVEGEYESGDYGNAGTVGENLVTADDAEYSDGDYGAAGTTGERAEHRLVDDEADVTPENDAEDGTDTAAPRD
ncbi:hypothetical protein [Arthrobacter sp. 24S4-2]|uniref:hypothetical protein n=1 Tax=Arthrobacter sp. 24S4-2 TaxID=2575374 RepID=UPI001586A4BD|nr:hypothetical protein [Arthrobacter sp. 24S4-2]